MYDRNVATAAFTLIELLIAVAILAIVMVLAVPYLLGTREKQELVKEQQNFVTVLKQAQNNSIIVKDGNEYQIVFDDINDASNPTSYYLNPPEQTIKGYTIKPSIQLISNNNDPITFRKLTGHTSVQRKFRMESARFWVEIEVSPLGVIEMSKPQPK